RIEVAADGEANGAIADRLREFARGDLAGRQEDDRPHASLCRVGGKRRAGVAGRGASDAGEAKAPSLRDCDSHATVSERTGRILAFVLELQPLYPGIGRE